ncbi:TPA: mannose-1-phosphate guanylyltransferase/mannose-6-phosphate isomerase [Vibrio parahaemolyticus]|uniref:mannose-1-phosphate guanylyltransferase n=1 Tax=Vibrio parahaemolyticus TaxID=670 RepID=A0A5P4SBG1_VIBPH|nr:MULTISPECIES: mannose-1-phosphate guanylyltransferase/mannose-6-phosphate isomerase [Vibrio]MDG2660801.1 mannose-1-phosphate guanylyltransferase/mannose-6-phosphate isomerase [Vibrio parahaemolyticus]OHX40907.1 mannose-1-phosphate guanylyltransferase/mannose-6-phosphate isomerase [Vibrio parahaemolyticus]QFC18251.1 mannose-1-phosphate guanylyltransferase/mannose-6-phosphate isomerase [Vibrio parahaemolyticus]HCH5062462.1 mannose-1-phosphate guanylyltransferase/mannose-6-phosphate isomerase [
MLIPVIMAGGSGSRLWPLSRSKYPKQFLAVTGEQTMLQQTLSRMVGLEHNAPFVICNEEHRFLVAEQLRRINGNHSGILLEPVGRNTAPAIALAAKFALSENQTSGEDALMLVLAADHVIKDTQSFHQSVQAAIPYAQRGDMVTFGIKANAPETGYGYIKTGATVTAADESRGFSVDSFVEKPDLETAKQYLEDGSYLWNSGMFLFKASTYLEELAKFRPDILKACESAYDSHFDDLDFIRMSSELFSQIPDESIDFAVMEKTEKAVVVPMDANWSDVGSWSALWDVNDKDEQGNATRGDVLTEQTQNSYIYSQDKLVATVGIENLIIVETKDAVLVADKDKVQDVKSIVNQLKQQNRAECQQHQEVYRPWGSHETVSEGERYHVKQVLVKPKEKTALQMHHHRAEHWVVVSGTAKVTKGDETFLLTENQSTYIPVGTPHSVENPGQVPLELIEVRSGSYLEEDDIVRFDEQASKFGGDY